MKKHRCIICDAEFDTVEQHTAHVTGTHSNQWRDRNFLNNLDWQKKYMNLLKDVSGEPVMSSPDAIPPGYLQEEDVR